MPTHDPEHVEPSEHHGQSGDARSTHKSVEHLPEGRYFDPRLDRVSRARAATDDPLAWFERRRASAMQAIAYLFAVPLATVLTGLLVLVISRMSGGPYCDDGSAVWLCTRRSEILFSLIPFIVAMTGTGGAFWITYRKWKTYESWRPWIGIIWLLVPLSLSWMTAFGGLFITGSH